MFWQPRKVEGTRYEVRPASATWVFEFVNGQPERSLAEQTFMLCAECVYRDDQRAMSAEEWGEQPFPLVKKLGELALEVNGLSADPIGAAEGN